QYPLIRPLVKLVLKRADAVIAVAQALKDVMVDLGCSEKKITVIRNGIDPVKFRPQSSELARHKVGLPADCPILLSVGRLNDNKGPHILIDTVALLRQKRPDLMLVIAGDGPNRSSLEAQIKNLDLQKN